MPGGQIVIGGLGRPDTLNPWLTESEAGRALVPLLFDSLLAHDPHTDQLIPRLSKDWSVSDDSRTITFTLRTDAHWHDGQLVTADDVVFSIEAARDPALDSLYGPQLGHVTEVNAADRRTVVINLDGPHCPSLAALGELPILPQHVLADSNRDTPIGSGPFVLLDWTAEGEVNLARNDAYWGSVAYLDSLSYRPFETPAELQSALENEQVEVALMPPGHPVDLRSPSPSISVYRYPAPEFLFIAFNNEHPILGDARVRQALSMAVDRQQLLETTLNGTGDLIAGSLPAAHWAADPTLKPPAYDPDAARQLLAKAGWSDSDGDGWLDRDGERLRLPVRTNGGNRLREDVATLVAGYYRAVGVDASVELVLWGAVVDDLFTHDFDIIVFSWPLRAEPDQSRWWLSTEDEIGSGYNFVSFADETVDRLLEEALAVPGCNPADRAELYRQVQGVLAQERPYDFLFVPYAALLARPDLGGMEVGPFASPLENAAAWYRTP
jgi:peptide/nickel transport system substrate-binding protein